MTLTVADTERVAEDVVRLRLVDGGGVPLPGFEAGAHVELFFAGFRRRYSLTSSPSDRSAYEVMVLRARPGRGGSAFIHDHLAVGDTVDVSEPVNGFAIDRRARHHVFIGGGIGLTPFYTMTEALAAAGQTFHVHYVVRSQARALRTDAFGEHVSLHAGPGARRSLGLPTLLAALDATTAVYGCGPVTLLDDLRRVSRDLDWPAGRLRVETFGPGAQPQDGPLSIRLSQSGTTLVAPPSASILDTLLAHGVFVGADCRRGECGACIVSVEDGDIDHRDVCLTPEQRRGLMCACVSWARTPQITLAL